MALACQTPARALLAAPAHSPSPLSSSSSRLAAPSVLAQRSSTRSAGASLRPLARRRGAARASAAPDGAVPVWGESPEHAASDYIALGLAQCFVKDESSKLQPVQVIEPIPAAALECLDNGGTTSYLHAVGTTLGVALAQDAALLPEQFQGSKFCDEFEFRTLCSARTWKRQHARDALMSLLPVGAVRSDFNFSTEDKRVLNMESEVTDDDNIKQDISIDVYGRKGEEEEAAKEAEIAKLYNV